MAFKHNTREDIHTGLTQSKSDQKWSDMLNFRSGVNRTFAILFKRKLFESDGKFHTLIRGVGDLIYVIGQKSSWVLRSRDDVSPSRLWKAVLKRTNPLRGNRSESLKIRGNYTGTENLKMRVTVVNGKLVTDTNWPKPKPTPPEVEPNISLNCGNAQRQLKFKLTVLGFNNLPVLRAVVEIYRGKELMETVYTNAAGKYKTPLEKGRYRVLVYHPDYGNSWETKFRIKDEDVEKTAVLSTGNPFMYQGVEITVRYSNTEGPFPGGHNCNAAVYKLLLNGIDYGYVNLNNAPGGGDVSVVKTINGTESQQIYAITNSNVMNVVLVCDPLAPGFDLDAWGGTCHNNIAWVIIKRSNGQTVYNGGLSGSLNVTF